LRVFTFDFENFFQPILESLPDMRPSANEGYTQIALCLTTIPMQKSGEIFQNARGCSLLRVIVINVEAEKLALG
jgi:hypothetical protein